VVEVVVQVQRQLEVLEVVVLNV
jgi:hypothetical protein